MKRLALTLALLAASAAPLAAQSPQLNYVLKQMDSASAEFKGATADFRWEYYDKVVKETTTQSGSIYFRRDGKSISMGARIFTAGNTQPDRLLEYKGGALRMFEPNVDQLTTIKAGANQAQYEGFLTLGFGGSGSDLARVWNIQDLGPETLSDGGKPIKVEKLDLTSKSGDKTFTHVTIWVDAARGVSLKQIFYATGGQRTATYSNIKIPGNVNMDKNHFGIKTDKNTTFINR